MLCCTFVDSSTVSLLYLSLTISESEAFSTLGALICYLLFAAHQYSAALSRRGEYGLLKSPSCDFGLDYFPMYEDISYDPNVMIMIIIMIMNVHMMMIMMSVPGISQPPHSVQLLSSLYLVSCRD